MAAFTSGHVIISNSTSSVFAAADGFAAAGFWAAFGAGCANSVAADSTTSGRAKKRRMAGSYPITVRLAASPAGQSVETSAKADAGRYVRDATGCRTND